MWACGVAGQHHPAAAGRRASNWRARLTVDGHGQAVNGFDVQVVGGLVLGGRPAAGLFSTATMSCLTAQCEHEAPTPLNKRAHAPSPAAACAASSLPAMQTPHGSSARH